MSLQLNFALFVNIVRVLLVKMKSNFYLERRRLRYRLVSCKVPFKLTAVCQSYRDIFKQVKPTPSKRSRSTHYSILETYGYILSTIKVFTEISTGLPYAFRCIEIHCYSSSIILLVRSVCRIFTFSFQLAVYCGTQAGGLSGKYLDTRKCKPVPVAARSKA